jgi:hypothetical protein
MANPGTPAHVPTQKTRDKVESLVAFGITQEQIARNLEISVDTLKKYYDDELSNGLTNAINEVANVLFSKAVEERDLAACTFFLKTRGRWREKDPEDNGKALSIIEQLIQSKK